MTCCLGGAHSEVPRWTFLRRIYQQHQSMHSVNTPKIHSILTIHNIHTLYCWQAGIIIHIEQLKIKKGRHLSNME